MLDDFIGRNPSGGNRLEEVLPSGLTKTHPSDAMLFASVLERSVRKGDHDLGVDLFPKQLHLELGAGSEGLLEGIREVLRHPVDRLERGVVLQRLAQVLDPQGEGRERPAEIPISSEPDVDPALDPDTFRVAPFKKWGFSV